MLIILIVALFSFGLVVGSFLNVVIYRTIHGEQWVRGRSRCDYCKKIIPWYDNIPLLSYIVLKGRCRFCHKRIAAQHFALELMTGFLFVWWYAIGFAFFRLTATPHLFIQPVFWLLVGIFLLIIFVTDWLYQIIPDYANWTLGFLALGYRVYLTMTGAMQRSDLWHAMGMGVGLTAFLLILWMVTKGKGMGLGDVKYALSMGVLLGWPRGLVAMLLAFVVGALVGILMIAFKLKKFKERIAFGPFLVLGTAVALLWGNQMWTAYQKLLGG